ncbi:endopeptidase La [Patescibacteria group bacterium]|nr:endopeptidase La [Patescibacteria group bacterium]MBU1967338.1 endopeptidase La [Patescibacteria group bacterium]MBU2543181.1 endopeptidase La [Patescibacteria group bacterium]
MTQPKEDLLSGSQLPSNQLILPVVPIREGVLFPSTESVLTFGRQISLNAIKAADQFQKLVILLTQKNPTVDQPQAKDLYQVGTLATIERTLDTEGRVNALVRGLGRVEIVRFVQIKPIMKARVIKLVDFVERDDEMKALTAHLQKTFRKAIHMGKPVEFLNFMKLMSGVTEGELADQIASTLNIGTDEKQQIIETTEVKERIKKIIEHLIREMKVLEIEKDVVHKTQKKFDKSMRENVLRERLRTIQKELGELEDEEEIAQSYEEQLKKLKLDKDIRKKITKEIKHLRSMSPNNPESGYVRSWLDTVFDIPWNTYNKNKITLKQAEKTLDESHYGLEEVKDRILEYLAVLQLKQKIAKDKTAHVPTILCFVGPPGVGKTSIGRSIADALGRKFAKASLGGIRDEAEIRGHRRTYVGALPGRIVSGIIQAKSMNPVFMLDEVDKIGKDFRGDPSSALLEALDPEQNKGFEDHYLDMPLDLSKVIFITTANTLDTIPPALRDRLEIIRYSGYTEEEKFHIARKHLWDKQLKANGLNRRQVKINDSTFHYAIKRYTREAGVRDLERTLGKTLRKIARKIAEENLLTIKQINLNPKQLKDHLGPEEYDVTQTEAEDRVGLATGLAWTSVGGDMLFIEVALTPGKGKVVLTGKLGEVMKESAQAALTYVKANLDKLGIDKKIIEETDVHVHVPEGATPKEGPSAGITIATAMISAFTNRPIKKEVAMTGEVTLRGRVLRIGGLKEKSIAAHRAGSKVVIIPQGNKRNLVDIPDQVKKDITFKPVETMDEVIKLALC